MTIARIYMENLQAAEEEKTEKSKSIYEELFQLKNILKEFKYHSTEENNKNTKLASPEECYKRKYGICFDLTGAAAYIWKNIIKSKRNCRAILEYMPKNTEPKMLYASHGCMTIEDDDGKSVFWLQPHMCAKCTIYKYTCYDSIYCDIQRELLCSNAGNIAWNFTGKSLYDQLKEKIIDKIDEAKPHISLYDPLDEALYKGHPGILEICKRILKFYGEIDLNKVDPERVKDSVDQII